MRIGIIGAGIIGATTALALVRRGHDVTLFDREGVASATSAGNAGAFAFTDIIPLATPGIMRKAPKWLVDPLGPLSIPPSYALQITPWLLRFFRAAMPDRYAASLAAQADLMAHSAAALERILAVKGLEPLIRREGQLQLYDTEASFRASMGGWEERARHGVRFDTLESAGAIAEIQPGLSPRFARAVFTPNWSNVTDPLIWTQTIGDIAQRAGVKLRIGAVKNVSANDREATVYTGIGHESFDRIVVAAGAWSNDILASLGLRLPLETERGYNTTFDAPGFAVKTHITFADHAFVMTRIGEKVRVGGAVELGGLKAAPNMKRAEALLNKAKTFVPGMSVQNGRQWMGFRPSMPDSLPVIGVHPASPPVVMAFGHGHLGLTQSAGTAELVADLIDGRTPAMDIKPFAPTRFGRVHA